MTISDQISPRTVLSTKRLYNGAIFNLVAEDVDLGEAGVVRREFIDHPGAVAVVALNDQDEVLLLRQYRHPVRADLWEVPAGLLDVEGEAAHLGAARELYEEADLTAKTWHVLTDYLTTPGGNNEAIRVYLARDLSLVPQQDRHDRVDEELNMTYQWVPLQECVDLVLSGNLHNPSAVVGILAAAAAKTGGWAALRAVDVEFPFRRLKPLN